MKLLNDVTRVLKKNWDPAGLEKEPDVQEDYDTFAAELVEMLDNSATEADIVGYLEKVVQDTLHVTPNNENNLKVAKKLLSLKHH